MLIQRASHVEDKKQLWLRLKAYQFEHLVPPHLTDHLFAAFDGRDASTRAFATKLARKLGWTNRFALRATEEYRKFLFLGITGPSAVTPSRVIDQVWHEHLLFTRAYREFCRDVLGRDFDHHPELVPDADQTDTFRSQYEMTLARYQWEFGVVPPADIWARPKFPRPAPSETARLQRDTGGSDGVVFVPPTDEPALHCAFPDAPSTTHPEFAGGGASRGWEHPSDARDGGDHAAAADAGDGGGSSCSSSCGGGCGGE